MALFIRLLWLLLIIPTGFGFARIGKEYQIALGTPTDARTSSVQIIEPKEEAKQRTATTPQIARTSPQPPMTSPENQSVVFFWKTDQGSVESRVAKVKGDSDVLEIMSEDRKLPILASRLVLVIAPLAAGRDIEKLTKDQMDLALNRYDKAEKMDELKMLLADDRAKRSVIQTPSEASVGTSAQRKPLPVLDVPTAAGAEEPVPSATEVKEETEAGWKTWVSWAKSLTGKALGR